MAASTDLSQFANYGQALQASMQDMQRTLKVATQAFSDFTQKLMDLAKVGLQGTQEANRLSFAWMLLTKQIASLFVPTINAVTGMIQRLTGYFAGLSGTGQAMWAMWSEVSIAIAALVVRLPIMAGLFKALYAIMSPWTLALAVLLQGLMDFLNGTTEGRAIMGLLTEAFEGLKAIMGAAGDVMKTAVDVITKSFQLFVRSFAWLGIKLMEIIEWIISWIPGLEGVVESIKKFRQETQASLDVAVAQGLGAKGAVKDKPRTNVSLANGQFESLGAAFQRVTEQANRMAGSPEDTRHKAQMEVQNKIADGVGKVEQAIRQQNPAIAR